MSKRYWHHVWTARIRPIKVSYILALFLVSATISVVALRNNNITMGHLRNAVYSADKNNGNVVKSLQTLQVYVTSHMNTNLDTGTGSVYPPIQLKYTYQRLVQEASVSETQANNPDLYTEAQKACEQQDSTDFSGHNRVPCIEQYVTDHGNVKQPTVNIPDSMYKFDFVSPGWSPDLAGWSVVITILLGIALILRMVAGFVLKRFTRT